jgi:hypothetical protein
VACAPSATERRLIEHQRARTESWMAERLSRRTRCAASSALLSQPVAAKVAVVRWTDYRGYGWPFSR